MSRYNSGWPSVILTFGIIALAFVLVIIVQVRGVLVSEQSAVRTLETQGYTNVQIADHSWFFIGLRGCDEKDAARFTARAKNPAGQEVTVYVCSGLLKGGTIRTP